MSWDTAGAAGGWNDGGATASGGGSGWNDGVAQPSFHDDPATNGYSGEDDGTNGYGDDGNGDGGFEGAGGGGNDGKCFRCGQEGHSKGECTNEPMARPCFNCGEEGHMKSDCPNPPVAREFTGECRLCGETGHRAADCPAAPPKICNNCGGEGHAIIECKNARKIDRSGIEDIAPETAWTQLKTAAEERDLDDVKEAALKYIKAVPDTTYIALENAFRGQGIKVYLIAIEKELAVTYTNMDLQGNLDRQYTVSWRLSDKPARPKEKDTWPSPEENLVRLANAGEPIDRGLPKCARCEQVGHISKNCSEEKQEVERAMVKCFNCDGIGHRVRDCPNPRPDKFACRNCGASGHGAKECPEPRNPATVECKLCQKMGHFSRDCPDNERPKRTCRNCDAEDHISKECPLPRDYSRVQCSNCKEMGHTKVRCKNPTVEEDGDGGDAGGAGCAGYGGGDGDGGYAGDAGNAVDDFNAGSAPAGDDGWGGDQAVSAGGW